MTTLRVNSLQAWRGGTQALQSVSFTASGGDVVALLGQNGAGKTTLLDVLSGLAPALTGTVALDEQDLLSCPPWQRPRLGVTRSFQELRLAWELSVIDHLKLAISAKDHGSIWSALMRRRTTRKREQELTQAAHRALSGNPLENLSEVPARELSFGFQKILAVSCSCQGDPALVLLDEPLSGLAADLKSWVLRRIEELAGAGATVLVAEHDLPSVQFIANKRLVLDGGAVIEYEPIEHHRAAASSCGPQI